MFSNFIKYLIFIFAVQILKIKVKPTQISSQTFAINDDSFFDQKPLDKNFSYIYAPAILATEIIMGRYCPKYIASTGEKVIWKNGGHIIGQPHTSVIFPEIDLKRTPGFTLNPLTILINNIRRDFFPIIQRYAQDKFHFTVEDNLDSKNSIINYGFNFSNANVGQKKDIEALNNTYNEHVKKYPNTDIILFGDSRGAATSLNFLAFHKPPQIKAVIFEGIFDDIFHCIKHMLYDDKDLKIEKAMHNVVSYIMRNYNPKGPFPMQCVHKIDLEIPKLFVTSLKDGLIAPQCTINLYIKLKELGHKKLHLLILENSSHPLYMIGDLNDKQKYEATVHAFYKNYNLPYNGQKALQGQGIFEKTQPSTDELKALNLPKCSMCLLLKP